MTGDHWIGAVIALQACATLSYLWAGDWRQSLVWLGVAVSNAAFLSLPRS